MTIKNGFTYVLSAGLALALTLFPVDARGQSCNSTGADGAYSPTVSGDFDPIALGLNAAGDNVFNFTTVYIPDGVHITMRASKMRSQRPVVFLASGTVNINGAGTALDLSGSGGQSATDVFSLRTPSQPGPGGYPGGAGAKPGGAAPEPGAGPGGAKIPADNTYGCSAGYATLPAGSAARCANATTVYDNPLIQPLVGGSGGSGGGTISGSVQVGGGGGAGGGAIRICSDVSITINGSIWGSAGIYANGGGGGGDGANSYGGGAGSGGAIHLQSPTVVISTAWLQAYGANASSGESSSTGRIRIDTNSSPQGWNASIYPPAIVGPFLTGPFGGVPLPVSPTLKIVSINGIPVPAQPQNAYTVPDVTMTAAGAVPIVVNTTNVPNGTTATFYVTTDASISPAANDIITTATVNNNAATLNVTLPQGVNRIMVRAVF